MTELSVSSVVGLNAGAAILLDFAAPPPPPPPAPPWCMPEWRTEALVDSPRMRRREEA